jgi:hypothetical protein
VHLCFLHPGAVKGHHLVLEPQGFHFLYVEWDSHRNAPACRDYRHQISSRITAISLQDMAALFLMKNSLPSPAPTAHPGQAGFSSGRPCRDHDHDLAGLLGEQASRLPPSRGKEPWMVC